jgi:hypothetical protein
MKQSLYKIVLAVSILCSFAFGYIVINTEAQAFLGFGGRIIEWVPCTCSGNIAILYIPTVPTNLVVPILTYNPYSSFLFSYYDLFVPGVANVGSYAPGVQACWMYDVVGCFPIPTQGLIFEVGTNAAPAS